MDRPMSTSSVTPAILVPAGGYVPLTQTLDWYSLVAARSSWTRCTALPGPREGSPDASGNPTTAIGYR
jgi:hypothetical protein